jgi:hypothetical protein
VNANVVILIATTIDAETEAVATVRERRGDEVVVEHVRRCD